jgi:hypothetical protein
MSRFETDNRNLTYINTNTYENYKLEYKYCKGCGGELKRFNPEGEEFDRATGKRIPGIPYLSCQDFSTKFDGWGFTKPLTGDHDIWEEVDLDEIPF